MKTHQEYQYHCQYCCPYVKKQLEEPAILILVILFFGGIAWFIIYMIKEVISFRRYTKKVEKKYGKWEDHI